MPRPIARNADDDIRVLNGLIAAAIGSAECYRAMVDLVHDDRSRAILLECADHRDDVVVRLHKHMWERGIPAQNDQIARETPGSVATSSSMTEILAELERSNALCRAQFDAALDHGDLSIATIAIIRECYASMQECEDQMRTLTRN